MSYRKLLENWKNSSFLINYLVGNSLYLIKLTIANNASFLGTVCVSPYRNRKENMYFRKTEMD